VIADYVGIEGNVVDHVCLSVVHSSFSTNWPLTLIFCMHMSHDHSSPGIACQGHSSSSRVTNPGLEVRSKTVF